MVSRINNDASIGESMMSVEEIIGSQKKRVYHLWREYVVSNR